MINEVESKKPKFIIFSPLNKDRCKKPGQGLSRALDENLKKYYQYQYRIILATTSEKIYSRIGCSHFTSITMINKNVNKSVRV